MKKFIFISALFISLLIISSCDSSKSNYDLLQGTWVSTDDANSELKIEGNYWIDIYEGESLSNDLFIISNDCAEDPNAENDNNGQYLTTFYDGMNYCYYIVNIDNENLELQFQGRGNTLVYKRK